MSGYGFPAPPEWVNQARCAQTGDIGFFPDNVRSSCREAISVCRSCPVQRQCFEWALSNQEQAGVWGGYDFASLPKRFRKAA